MAGTGVLTTDQRPSAGTPTGVLVYTFTADAANGSFPTKTLPRIAGFIQRIQTNPGAVAPTDNYDITLVDDDGIDRLGGAGQNRDTTTSEGATVAGGVVAASDNLVLTLANNSVNSAVTVVSIYWSLVAGGGGATDASGSALVAQTGTATNASAQVTISNVSGTIIAARTGRRGVMVKNFQTVPIYVDPAGGSATTSNSRLDAGAAQFYPVTSAITAITSAAYSASGDAKVHYDEYY